VRFALWCACRRSVRGLTFELTRPERTADLPGRRTIANLRRPGKQPAVEGRVLSEGLGLARSATRSLGRHEDHPPAADHRW